MRMRNETKSLFSLEIGGSCAGMNLFVNLSLRPQVIYTTFTEILPYTENVFKSDRF